MESTKIPVFNIHIPIHYYYYYRTYNTSIHTLHYTSFFHLYVLERFFFFFQNGQIRNGLNICT